MGSLVLRLRIIRRSIVFAFCAMHVVAFDLGNAAGASETEAPLTVMITAAPAPFSPNGDGRRDVGVFAVVVDQPAVVDVRVLTREGIIVRSLVEGQSIERELRLTWDGRRNDGARAADGAYRVVATARDFMDDEASAAATVQIDTAPPSLKWRISPRTIRATPLRARYMAYDRSASLVARFRLVNAYGRTIRGWRRRGASRGLGSFTVAGSRALLPGVYRVEATLSDLAGNRSRLRRSNPIRVNHAVRTRVVARVEKARGRVALTFDDCFVRSSWDSILRTLARMRVTAAFFCPGHVVRESRDLAARTVRAGHTLGSHGWDHALLPATGYSGVFWRLARERDLWWRWGSAATPYFRPPYGAYNGSVLAAAGAAGYRYTVLWDFDPRDWTNPGVAAIVSRAVTPARSGSIILLHVKPQTAAAVPHIIRRLRARGLTPVGLDELLHRPGAAPSRAGWSPRLSRAVIGAP